MMKQLGSPLAASMMRYPDDGGGIGRSVSAAVGPLRRRGSEAVLIGPLIRRRPDGLSHSPLLPAWTSLKDRYLARLTMDTSSSSAASAPSEEPQLSVIDQRGADPPTEKWICFTVKYAGSPLDIRLAEDDRVSDMKAILFSLTDVPAPRQKLIGLSRGKLPPDDTRIADLAIPPLAIKARQPEMLVAILLVGTPEAATFKDPSGQIHFIEVRHVNPALISRASGVSLLTTRLNPSFVPTAAR